MKKALCTKQFYVKNNKLIHAYPLIHAEAMYTSVRLEETSRLLEAILLWRCAKTAAVCPIKLDANLSSRLVND